MVFHSYYSNDPYQARCIKTKIMKYSNYSPAIYSRNWVKNISPSYNLLLVSSLDGIDTMDIRQSLSFSWRLFHHQSSLEAKWYFWYQSNCWWKQFLITIIDINSIWWRDHCFQESTWVQIMLHLIWITFLMTSIWIM